MSEDRIQLVPELTAIAQTYRNKKCIADEIFPKVKVTTSAFPYKIFGKETFMDVPETEIGEKGIPNDLEIKAKVVTDKVTIHSLKEAVTVAKRDEYKVSTGEDIGILVTKQLTDVLKLRKEIETAKFFANKTNYGANVKTLESSEKINKADSNAVKLIKDAMDNVFYHPNTMVLSRLAASALSQNPYIVSACGISDKKAGIVSLEAIKELFGLDKVLVGEGIHNVAKKGQNALFQNCWQNDIYLLSIDETVTADYGISFGWEAVYDNLTVGTYFDGAVGTKGADVYKAFYSNKIVSSAPELGYCLKDVLA